MSLTADEIETQVNNVIATVSKRYKEETEKAIILFVDFYIARFLEKDFQEMLCKTIQTNLIPQVMDDRVILKPRISVELTSDKDPDEIKNSKVWEDDVCYKLAIFHLDNKIKDVSNNTFCIEEHRNVQVISVNCASVRGDIKFFV